MRFDDSLDTVLAAEISSPAGVQSAWRQIVDLIGRGRAEPRLGAMARLRSIRDDVPAAVRAASARGLERADPPAELVALFADDELAVAAPVVRSARLSADQWIALLPAMRPATRGILRHRRDLSPDLVRALASFGPSDFALLSDAVQAAPVEGAAAPIVEVAPEPVAAIADVSPVDITREPVGLDSLTADAAEPTAASPPPAFVPLEAIIDAPDHEPPAAADAAVAPGSVLPEPDAAASQTEAPAAEKPAEAPPAPAFVPPDPSPFVTVADIARELPIIAEARRQEAPPAPAIPHDAFEISRLVERIEAHRRAVEDRPAPATGAVDRTVDGFRFETDAAGIIRWCDGVDRSAVIGLSLTAGRDGAPVSTDGVAAGALVRRARFANARFVVDGAAPAAGTWRINGLPVFDDASGRFTGYRGTARRPRADEEPRLARATPATDALRQLVHELRTPANAISGFAEMIEHEMLGPVAPAYRDQAGAIRGQTAHLLGAIDDLDTAARIESGSLPLHTEAVALTPLLTRVLRDLNSLAELRGAGLTLDVGNDTIAAGDARALERMFSRLLTALLASATAGETVAGQLGRDGDSVRLIVARPVAFAVGSDTALFGADAELEAASDGGPLLGAGFAFRLARRLISELGGSLIIGTDTLTLRLPAAVDRGVEQATV